MAATILKLELDLFFTCFRFLGLFIRFTTTLGCFLELALLVLAKLEDLANFGISPLDTQHFGLAVGSDFAGLSDILVSGLEVAGFGTGTGLGDPRVA